MLEKIGFQIEIIHYEKCENEIQDDKKNIQSFQRYSFPQNRFYGLKSSQRPPASVGVEST